MFKSESLSHQINVIRLITRILRNGLVALTVKRIKETRICNSARQRI